MIEQLHKTPARPADIEAAADWLEQHWSEVSQPLVAEMRERFGLRLGDTMRTIAEVKRRQRGRR